jgi:hypothetical protein
MTSLYVNENPYGLILLRNSYEEALAESEEMYDRECERKGTPTPKSERTTQYLLGVKENVLSGQVGLHIPPRKPHIQVPADALYGEHIDNPLWINYDWIHGEPKMVLGSLPFGQFGVGVVEPAKTRKVLEGHFSPALIEQVRDSTRQYTVQVHTRTSELINSLLRRGDIKEHLRSNVDADLFEELVADLLRDQGYDVFLTRRSGDGGKDIWASSIHDGRRVMALVECKVRSGARAIDPAIARAVVGTYFIERIRGIDIDAALLVTTSDNVGPASLDIQQQVRQFGIKDCNEVVNWIGQYGTIRNGLWVPGSLTDNLL